jgi:nicotinamide-nucleotide amidase
MESFSAETLALCGALAQALRQQGKCMAAAESCTGGLIAGACTSLSGSSDWFERGFVTYSNAAKTDMLGVPPELIAQHGAVSEAAALAMARGALAHSLAHCAVAVTGVAGPLGGSADKPVGTVWLAWALVEDGGVRTECSLQLFPGDRQAVRHATVNAALAGLLQRL